MTKHNKQNSNDPLKNSKMLVENTEIQSTKEEKDFTTDTGFKRVKKNKPTSRTHMASHFYIIVIISLILIIFVSIIYGLKSHTSKSDDEMLATSTNQSSYNGNSKGEYVTNNTIGTITGNNTQGELPPNVSFSNTPEIVSAVTLKGTVLSTSNVDATRSFGAEKTIDKYYDTCWCANASLGGTGAQIQFNLHERSEVKGFMMVNGNIYRPETDIFRSNGQVQSFTLTFSDGSSQTFTANYNEFASNGFEYFNFTSPVITDYIILTVNSGYIGKKFTNNVAISEVDVF